jgi:hypothetical protein
MNDRQRAAIASRVAGYERQQVSDAGVGGAPPPPKASTSGSASGSPPKTGAKPGASTGATDQATPSGEQAGKASASSASSSSVSGESASPTDPPDQTSESTSTNASEPSGRSRYYEPKAFKKWVEENPEQAAELHKSAYGQDPQEGFIQLQNKSRKVKSEIREARAEAERAITEQREKAEAAKAQAEQIAGSLRYMSDMWAAASKKDAAGKPIIDFDTIDEAFRQNTGGMSLDDYNRLRARRGVASPELAR